jgi:polyhydroxyalkanoate depolymerase
VIAAMLYLAYDAQADFISPVRQMASMALANLGLRKPEKGWLAARHVAATYELIERAGLTHVRPDFRIGQVKSGNREVSVKEQVVLKLPFGSLLHFKKDTETPQPLVLVVAPLSGHFATLLRNTISTLLTDHDVYVTDWHNARDISSTHGPLGFDDYITHLIRFIEAIGPDAHIVAVCQPCVQTLAAVAVMAEDRNACVPRSMTLMAGPVDTRINPTEVNKLATGKPIDWFRRNLIARVPSRYPGAGRRVYPGFVQLTAFMSMNLQRHIKAHSDLYEHIVDGEIEKAMAIKMFYDEYFAVLDLPAEFYLETVEWIFQEARLATGKLTYQGRKIDCGAIRRTVLLTVEGERDDICALGQTSAAHELCRNLKPFMKRHHMQAGVGHYGVFSGKRWESQIYPIVRNQILSAS